MTRQLLHLLLLVTIVRCGALDTETEPDTIQYGIGRHDRLPPFPTENSRRRIKRAKGRAASIGVTELKDKYDKSFGTNQREGSRYPQLVSLNQPRKQTMTRMEITEAPENFPPSPHRDPLLNNRSPTYTQKRHQSALIHQAETVHPDKSRLRHTARDGIISNRASSHEAQSTTDHARVLGRGYQQDHRTVQQAETDPILEQALPVELDPPTTLIVTRPKLTVMRPLYTATRPHYKKEWHSVGEPLSMSKIIAMNSLGTVLAVAKANGHLQVYSFDLVHSKWNKRGNAVRVSLDSTERDWSVSLNNNGTVLVFGDSNQGGSVQAFRYFEAQQIWLHLGQERMLNPPGITEFASHVAISGSGYTIVVGGSSITIFTFDHSNHKWRHSSNSAISQLTIGNVTSLNENGTVVALGNTEDVITVFNSNDPTRTFFQMGQDLKVSGLKSVSLSADANVLAVATQTSVEIYEFLDSAWTSIGTLVAPGFSIDLSSDGSVLAIYSVNGVQVYQRVETNSWKPMGIGLSTTGAIKVVLSSDGRGLTILGTNDIVQTYSFEVPSPQALQTTKSSSQRSAPALPTASLPSEISPSTVPSASYHPSTNPSTVSLSSATTPGPKPTFGPSSSHFPSTNPTSALLEPVTSSLAGTTSELSPSTVPSASYIPSTNPSTLSIPSATTPGTKPTFRPSLSIFPSTNPTDALSKSVTLPPASIPSGLSTPTVPSTSYQPSTNPSTLGIPSAITPGTKPTFGPSLSYFPSTDPTRERKTSTSTSTFPSASASPSLALDATMKSSSSLNVPFVVHITLPAPGADLSKCPVRVQTDVFNIIKGGITTYSKDYVDSLGENFPFAFEVQGELTNAEDKLLVRRRRRLQVTYQYSGVLGCKLCPDDGDVSFLHTGLEDYVSAGILADLQSYASISSEASCLGPGEGIGLKLVISSSPSTPQMAHAESLPSSSPLSDTIAPATLAPVVTSCVDSDSSTFFIDVANPRATCSWLRQQAQSRIDTLCFPSVPPFYLCPKTCRRC